MANDALRAQIEADPRVRQLADSRRKGSMPGWVSAAELIQMGYPVTDNGWKYVSGDVKFGRPRIIDESDKWDKIVGTGAGLVMGYGMNNMGEPSNPSPSSGDGYPLPGQGAGGPAGYPPPGAAPTTPLGETIRRVAQGGQTGNTVLDLIKKYAPLALAGGSALAGLKQRPTPAEGQLNDILGMAKGRAEASEPLFKALMAMSQAQLPKYTRGE